MTQMTKKQFLEWVTGAEDPSLLHVTIPDFSKFTRLFWIKTSLTNPNWLFSEFYPIVDDDLKIKIIRKAFAKRPCFIIRIYKGDYGNREFIEFCDLHINEIKICLL